MEQGQWLMAAVLWLQQVASSAALQAPWWQGFAATWAWLQFALLAGLIGLFSGLIELINVFGNESLRSLRTFGAWLLLGVNFFGAALIFVLVSGAAPGVLNAWGAIVVGLAWPTVVRNLNIKLGQPIEGDPSQQAALRMEEAYNTLQKHAKQMIDGAVVRQRMRLLRELTELEITEMERLARRTVALSTQADPKPALAYITEIINEPDVEVRRAMLAAYILNNFGRDVLEDEMSLHKKGRRRNPANPTGTQGDPAA